MERTIEHVTFHVKGMTCGSCEQRIQKAVAKRAGVITVKANQAVGRVEVDYEPKLVSRAELATIIEASGYTVMEKAHNHFANVARIFGIGAVMIVIYMVINASGGFNFLPKIDSSIGLAMIFVAGLLTSVHCVAMCGGIALSQQAKSVQGIETLEDARAATAGGEKISGKQWLMNQKPGAMYHLGRIVSYTILGGVVGAIGSVVSFSPVTKGILAGVAGLFMVFLGLKMLGALPFLHRIKIKLPRLVSPKIINSLRGRGPFFVGLLNGFMPCGPLQTMQLYALGTGSVVLGALSMFIFSVGTVPLMFTFGAISSVFNKTWQQRLIRVSAILVVFFGVIMAGRALDLSGASGSIRTLVASFTGGSNSSLAGIGGADSAVVASTGGSNGSTNGVAIAQLADGVQNVSFDLQPGSYKPIAVQKGVPVRWTINATEDNLNGCNGEIIVPSLGLQKKLKLGANLIEFTPTASGQVSYTCWMGMISSTIYVVDKLDAVASGGQALPGGNPQQNLQTPNLGAGGGCCAGGSNPRFAGGKIPTDQVQIAMTKTEKGVKIQEVTITVDDQGYSPAVIVLQRGVQARIKFNPKQLSSCNGTVDFPAYGGRLSLSQGQLETPLIPISQDFTFQCGMAMLHGYVKVVDDLAKVDLAQVRKDVAAYKPPAGAGGGGCCGGGSQTGSGPSPQSL